MVIKILLLLAFFAVMIGVGYAYRRHSANVSGFILGGRNVGPWLTAFAYGTSYFSAVLFIGYAGQFGWKFGISAAWIGVGNALIGSLLAWTILGRRTRLMTQKLDSATMPDFFGKRFSSKGLRIAGSAIVFVFLIPYTASLYNGLSRLFTMAFGIDYIWCVLAMAVLTGIYVILGGYVGTAVNNFIQGVIMLVGVIVVVGAVLMDNGGFTQAVNALSQIPAETNPNMSGALSSFFGPQPEYLLGVLLLTSLGTWGLPQLVGKFYAINNEASINKGAIISTIFAFVVSCGCFFLGGFGRLYGDVIAYNPATGAPIYDSIIPQMLSGMSDIVIGIVVILVLSASMSTLAALVLTSGSSLTLDILVPASKKKVGEKTVMLWIRGFVLFFIVVSAAIAIVQAKSSVTFIAQLMGISWGALAGAFLGPFLYSLYWKRTTKAAVIVSFISGVGIMTVNMFCNFTKQVFLTPYFTSPINAGVLAMVVGLVLVPVVSLLTKAPPPADVEEMFSCYQDKIAVHAKTALGNTWES